MNCPKCRADVDLSRPECSHCGVDLLQAYEDKAWADKPGAEPARAGPRADRFLIALAAVAGVAAGGWALVAATRSPAALPAAWTSLAHGFAFIPPAGWTLEEKIEAEGPWVEALRVSRPPATILVLIGGPRSGTPLAAARAAEDRFNGVRVKLAPAEAIQIGGREAWSVRVSGERAMLPSPNRGKSVPGGAPAPDYESMDFEAESILIPGGRRSYLIQLYSERADFRRQHGSLARFLEGFSIL